MRITKEYAFEAAHWLPNVAEEHQCRRLHGHTYRFELTLDGPIDPQHGWVVDYGEISKVVKPVIEACLDHRCLNDVLPNPTAELLAAWLGDAFSRQLPALVAVTVRETGSSSAIWYAGAA